MKINRKPIDPDLTPYFKHDGSVAMTGGLDLNQNFLYPDKTNDPNTYFYRAGANHVALKINNTNNAMQWQENFTLANSHIRMSSSGNRPAIMREDPSATNPVFVLNFDPATTGIGGLNRPAGSEYLSVIVAQWEKVRFGIENADIEFKFTGRTWKLKQAEFTSVESSGYPKIYAVPGASNVGHFTFHGDEDSGITWRSADSWYANAGGQNAFIVKEEGNIAAIHLPEITTPTALADYGAIYTKNDNKLYFQDGAGNEHEVAFV